MNFYARLPRRPFFKTFKKIYFLFCDRRLKTMKRLGKDWRNVFSRRQGINYCLDLSETIDSAVYYRGYFEPLVRRIIDKFVKPGMVVFDIGANIGCHTFYFAKKVGEEGRVFAFEPMSRVFQRLKKNAELNSFKNVVLEKIALSDINRRNQTAWFQNSYPLFKTKEPTDRKAEEKIDFFTLDDYTEERNLKRIDFIKIDVDGYEYKILWGSAESLKKFQPLMIIEFGKNNLEKCGDILKNLINFLVSLGYSFYSEKDLTRYPNRESLIYDASGKEKTVNIFCLPAREF